MTVTYTRLNNAVRDKFGIEVTYTPEGGAPRTVKAIVDRAYFSETGSIGIQSESFVLNVVDADLPELLAGDAFTVGAVNYTAVEIKPDFYGMSDIILNKA